LVPQGNREGRRPVKLRGEIPAHAATEDCVQRVIDRRRSLPADLADEERDRRAGCLKVLATSTSDGIFAELNRQEVSSGKTQSVTVYGSGSEPFTCQGSGPEEPGAFCFPPVAAFIAGTTRLMLARRERGVTDCGRTHAIADTDAMAIVATAHGSLAACPGGPLRSRGKDAIRALSWAQAEAIRQLFPYT
jgi:hypothetical protein